MADLDAEGVKSGDDAHGSPRVHLAERKRGLAPDNDSKPESKANFRHGGRKRCETVTPRDSRVNLGDDFFDDAQSCSGEPANLEDIGEFDLAQEATPIVDEQLLEDISRAAKSSAPKATPGIGKDIEIMRRQTSPHEVGSSTSRETDALRTSATQSHHSVNGPNSREVATRGLLSADTDVGTPGGSKGKLSCAATPSTTSFCPGPSSQSIFTATIRVMWSKYLTCLKNAKFEEVEEKLQSAPMIYKGIGRLCGDPTPLKKKVEDYASAMSAFLSLKNAASSCRHPDDVAKEKALCTKQVNHVRSCLATARVDLGVVMEKLKGMAQRIVDLEDTLRLAREEECQLKSNA